MFDYYVNTINEYLQEFLDRNEFDCDCSLGNNFSYLFERSLITYSLVVADSQGESFLAFCEKLFPNIHADVFLWSFLHELGHHETLDDFDNNVHRAYYYRIKNYKLSSEEYYNLTIEKAATVWAGEFMQNNPEEVQRLWNNIQPVMIKLYTEI